MLSLTYSIVIFAVYFFLFVLFYQLYFRHRIYLLLLAEHAYMDHYIDKLPHIRDRPDERLGMIEFMLSKRRAFVRRTREFVAVATVAYLVALVGGAAL
ncbi:hypothetical protein [Desulfovibrio sp. TomC]|uniref:hypothetical protein n=1 Tax=Desulfovibrio sp. TomC TaxID=1562888 RepID=UPI0005730E4E|nr:hypothetical protein [Desulfovibrio sp. TomC]KHK02202.1 hypothetical protein NY78_2333 [Desulfovibrio sp. TomC]